VKLKEEIMGKININKLAPDFSLLDCMDNEFKLSSFNGRKNVLLILNRGFV
jgi:peroxiredoxin